YGMAAFPSPKLLYSNILWGHFIQLIPSINGILGYSIVTLLSIFVAGSTILYFMRKLGVSLLPAFVVICLILTRPILFPQFTINAGLFVVAAVLGCLCYDRSNNIITLGLSCVLAFLGFLVRDQEFLLVLFIALPFFPVNRLKHDKKFRLLLVLTAIA